MPSRPRRSPVRRRDRSGLAAALLVEALAAANPAAERAKVEEAASIFDAVGDPLGRAEADLTLAEILGGPEAEQWAEQCRAGSCAAWAPGGWRIRRPRCAPASARETRAPVAIRAMGGFQVVRDDGAVATSEWQSRKSRDLLKILVSRRGRPGAPRRADRSAVGRRGSGQGVEPVVGCALDRPRRSRPAQAVPGRPLPGRRPQHGAAPSRARRRRRGAVPRRRRRRTPAPRRRSRRRRPRCGCSPAEAAYAGDAMGEDAVRGLGDGLARRGPPRLHGGRPRALAEDASAAGDHDAALRYLLRILERDTYDEPAHLAVVGAPGRRRTSR